MKLARTVPTSYPDVPVTDTLRSRPLDIAVVVPTYNEAGNVAEVVARVEAALQGLEWELIFVDDDSPDGTSELVRAHAERDTRIRLIQRIGRRGLSSACIEGILSTSAGAVAIMDGDLQHDEAALPAMFGRLRERSLDIVVGTRNACGGSMGEFGRGRVMLSRVGRRVSQGVCGCRVSDPMSGFFIVNRSFFDEVVHKLHGASFKILVDMLASSSRTVRLGEVGYTFRSRRRGESKLDVNTGVEYLLLILDKLSARVLGRSLPARVMTFGMVTASAAATDLLSLAVLLQVAHVHFADAALDATVVVLLQTFLLNSLFASTGRKLRGIALITALISFALAGAFGVWASVVFAIHLQGHGVSPYFAAACGIVVSTVWNFAMASLMGTEKARDHAAAASSATTPSYAHLSSTEL